MSGPPAVVLLGPGGLAAGRTLRDALAGARLHGPEALAGAVDETFRDAGAALRALFASGTPILALCATGIVIRALASLLADKRTEPPVVAIAEDGGVAVPLLGGHRRANALASEAAAILGGRPAITTAGDVRFGLALDAPPPGWVVRNSGAAKAVTAALLAGRPVKLEVEHGPADWLTAGGAPFAAGGDPAVLVSAREVAGDAARLVIHPRVLALGVGCERGAEPAAVIELAEATLARRGLARHAVACVASLDLKADEPAVQALADAFGVPARFFDAAALEALTPRLANPSAEVFAAVGCHGVAEAAALAAAGPGSDLIASKTKGARATCAIALAPAPIDPAQAGRPRGALALVGIGPGDAAWRTAEADALLARAGDWVGYRGYLDLLDPVRFPHARRYGFALGEEEARCRAALDLAAAGGQVALISSGDFGIYAMAALVFELLERADDPAWARVAITVAPGVSALQAAAARAGAPLGHDFCAISLSDLLTPWAEIERRLEAAAAGDFVTALYNPASSRRREQLTRALAILGRARPPGTPVVHARSLGRPGETVETVAIAEFEPATVDMLSLLIVGSSRTRLVGRRFAAPWVYTPRGYAIAEAVRP